MKITNNRNKKAIFVYKSKGKTFKVRLKPNETVSLPNLKDVNQVINKKTISNFTKRAPSNYSSITENIKTIKVNSVDNTNGGIGPSIQTSGNFEIKY